MRVLFLYSWGSYSAVGFDTYIYIHTRYIYAVYDMEIAIVNSGCGGARLEG